MKSSGASRNFPSRMSKRQSWQGRAAHVGAAVLKGEDRVSPAYEQHRQAQGEDLEGPVFVQLGQFGGFNQAGHFLII